MAGQTVRGPGNAQYILPGLPVAAFQTFSIRSPRDTLIKTACELAGCQAWRDGWESAVDERTDLGLMRATYIRQGSGRTFRELRRGDGWTVFRFEPGQRCFATHQTLPEHFLVRDGDWRGNPSGRIRRHTRAADWVEHLGEHQQQIIDDRQKG